MGDAYAMPIALVYMFLCVGLLARRYVNQRMGRRAGLATIAIIFALGASALCVTEYFGGSSAITWINLSLILSFCTCFTLSYADMMSVPDDKNVAKLFLRGRWSTIVVVIREQGLVKTSLDFFFYLLNANLLFVMYGMKNQVNVTDDGDVCFMKKDIHRDSNVDGGVGKMKPESEFATQLYITYVMGFYSAYFAFYRRVFASMQNADEHVAYHKHALLKKESEIAALSNAWIIDFGELKFRKKIGIGSSGEVWRGTLRDRYDVAIKRIHSASGGEENLLVGDDEIRFFQRARHSRLVMFLGCGKLPGDSGIFIVLEYCDGGNLSNYLYGIPRNETSGQWDARRPENRRRRISSAGSGRGRPAISEQQGALAWRNRVRLLVDIAEGMAYLHLIFSCIHRDLKCANCLLSRERSSSGEIRAKVADFALCRFEVESASTEHEKVNTCEEAPLTSVAKLSSKRSSACVDSDPSPCADAHLTMTAGRGTPVFMAPEIVASLKESHCKYSRAIDVYSFGMIMYASLELRAPWSAEFGGSFCYPMFEAVLKGQRPKETKSAIAGAPGMFCQLMRRCWDQNPAKRPPFNEILSNLQDISESFRERNACNASLDNASTDGSRQNSVPATFLTSPLRSIASYVRGKHTPSTERCKDTPDAIGATHSLSSKEEIEASPLRSTNEQRKLPHEVVIALAPLPHRPSPKHAFDDRIS